MLVEVLAGIISAAILGLTMGALLYYNYKGWTGLQAVADMQRDGSLAMNTMNRVIRGASTNMQWVSASSYLLVKNTNNVEGWRFTKTGDRLVYAVSGGSSMDLVRKGVVGFTCIPNTTNLVVWLNLTESSMNTSMNLTNTIFPRN